MSTRSTDLSPWDLFLWGFIEDFVYRNPPHTAEDLKAKISPSIEELDTNILSNVYKNGKSRVNLVVREKAVILSNYSTDQNLF